MNDGIPAATPRRDPFKADHDPFQVNEERALDALNLAWGDVCDKIWACGGQWCAHYEGAPASDVLAGATPDELNAAIRADWAARSQP